VRKLAAIAMLVAGVGMAVVVAERIYTNPKPEGYFRQFFPDAVAFSSFAGEPLHYKVYGIDPKANPSAPPIGFIFWTTDVVPREHGYHGPIHILVGMNTSGVITGAVVDYHSDPYGYFSVEPPEFAAQFKGKHIREPFRMGWDVHAVSRATISITSGARAIRDSARIMAKTFLTPAQVNK
jgi:transcriptional regulator of nitric oxide reductase